MHTYSKHVSIHAPRVGRDADDSKSQMRQGCFNPRAPCGARPPPSAPCGQSSCFNPRAPCGARPRSRHDWTPRICFNPRAPCGARHAAASCDMFCSSFQSTRPVWGATAKEVTTSLFCHIFMGITRHKYDFLDV